MKTFFTSDHHFGHRAILGFQERPWRTVEEMDKDMIRRWNEVVQPNDHIYHLGDFSFHKEGETRGILCALNGILHVVKGNHDHSKHVKVLEERAHFVKDYHEFKLNKEKFVLCHYPFDVWKKSHGGAYHFHGHSHGNLKTSRYRRLDVSVDAHDFYPVEMEKAMRLAEKNGTMGQSLDHHGAKG